MDLQTPQVLFLLAGFGTRLQKDINASPAYSHLSNLPKALVPLGLSSTPLLDFWIDIFKKYKMLLQTNKYFYDAFVEWKDSKTGWDITVKSNGIS
jgi:hypothetical protein